MSSSEPKTESTDREADEKSSTVNVLAVHYADRQLEYSLQAGRKEVKASQDLETDLESEIRVLTKALAGITTAARSHFKGLGASLANSLLPKRIADTLAQLIEGSAGERSEIEAAGLWIVSDDELIPWELLRPHGSRPMGEALRIARWRFDLPCPRTLSLETVGRVVSSFSGLQNAVEEANLLAQIVDDLGSEFIIIEAQTEAILDQLETDPPATLHCIAHAEQDEGSPLLSSLLLDDGSERLLVSDLAGPEIDLRSRSPLIFLNACETATAGITFAGLTGFAQEFVKLGAGAFVGTHWRIDDKPAPKVADSFYGSLGAGNTIGEALRRARVEVSDEIEDDPSRFAGLGYTLFGHPDARLDSGLGPASAVRWTGKYLEIPRFEYTPEESPPGALLRADHGIVPFHHRNQELDSLLEWAYEERELGIRLYTGPGGMGKTRLALELCHRLRDEGWRAGFVKSKADQSVEEAVEDMLKGGGPVLAVVDYAETRRTLLVPLARRLNELKQDGPFRVILLARRREEWWEQLKREETPVGEVFAGPATRHFSLQPLAIQLEGRKETFQLAAESFAGVLQQKVPGLPELNLEERYFDPVLMIHMYALGDVLRAVEEMDLKDEDGILDSSLGREKRFWERQMKARSLPDLLLPGVSRTMCAITLGGGTVDREGTMALMERLNFFKGQPRAVLESIASLLHVVYPGDRWVAPILPDILGEHLIERELVDDPQEVFDIVLGPRQVAN